MKVLLAVFGFIFLGLFGTMVSAKSNPINYSTTADLTINPAVCQIYADTLSLALMGYATDQPLTYITSVMDEGILANIKDDEQYLGRTMASVSLAPALKIIRDEVAQKGSTMANKTTMAAKLTEDAFISCRQDVGKTRGVYRRI